MLQGSHTSLNVLEFSILFKALKIFKAGLVLKSLNLSYLFLESPGIFLPSNTVICGHRYCYNDDHLVI